MCWLLHFILINTVAPPSWIESKVDEGNERDEEEKEQQIICLMSPEQK